MIFVFYGLLRPEPCQKEGLLEMCWTVQTQLPELWAVMPLAMIMIKVKVFRDLSAPLNGIFVLQLQRCSKCYPLAHLTGSQQQKALCTQPVCLPPQPQNRSCVGRPSSSQRRPWRQQAATGKLSSICAGSVANPGSSLWQQGMMFTCPWSIVSIDDNERFPM